MRRWEVRNVEQGWAVDGGDGCLLVQGEGEDARQRCEELARLLCLGQAAALAANAGALERFGREMMALANVIHGVEQLFPLGLAPEHKLYGAVVKIREIAGRAKELAELRYQV
jgi:hypothetical protein